MKIKRNFVTNSSTTAYVCIVCGETVGAYDSESMEDCGFMQCENGHELCESCLPDNIDVMKNEGDYEGEILEKYCTICTLKTITDKDLLSFLQKEGVIERQNEENIIREQFKNYEDFQKWLK